MKSGESVCIQMFDRVRGQIAVNQKQKKTLVLQQGFEPCTLWLKTWRLIHWTTTPLYLSLSLSLFLLVQTDTTRTLFRTGKGFDLLTQAHIKRWEFISHSEILGPVLQRVAINCIFLDNYSDWLILGMLNNMRKQQ